MSELGAKEDLPNKCEGSRLRDYESSLQNVSYVMSIITGRIRRRDVRAGHCACHLPQKCRPRAGGRHSCFVVCGYPEFVTRGECAGFLLFR